MKARLICETFVYHEPAEFEGFLDGLVAGYLPDLPDPDRARALIEQVRALEPHLWQQAESRCRSCWEKYGTPWATLYSISRCQRDLLRLGLIRALEEISYSHKFEAEDLRPARAPDPDEPVSTSFWDNLAIHHLQGIDAQARSVAAPLSYPQNG